MHPAVHTTHAYIAPKALPKFGRRRCPPLGPSIRRPTVGCATRAGLLPDSLSDSSRPITAGKSEKPSSLCKAKILYPSLCLSPGARGSSEPGPKFLPSVSCWLMLVDFFAFRNAFEKRQRKNTEKNTKIKDFGFPKPFQNPSKMPSKSMSYKTCIFSSNLCLFWLFSALCAFCLKCLKPSKNCGFVALRAYQHCVFVGT